MQSVVEAALYPGNDSKFGCTKVSVLDDLHFFGDNSDFHVLIYLFGIYSDYHSSLTQYPTTNVSH
jgi:hypothetical protein